MNIKRKFVFSIGITIFFQIVTVYSACNINKLKELQTNAIQNINHIKSVEENLQLIMKTASPQTTKLHILCCFPYQTQQEIEQGRTAIFQLCNSNKFLINTINEYGWTSLMVACFFQNYLLVPLLLNLGADCTLQDIWNQTVLDIINLNPQKEAIVITKVLLKKHGALPSPQKNVIFTQ